MSTALSQNTDEDDKKEKQRTRLQRKEIQLKDKLLKNVRSDGSQKEFNKLEQKLKGVQEQLAKL